MLQTIHDRATGVIAWIIVILITIPFALWGINSYFEGGADLNVATINDQDVSQRDFERVYRNRRQALVQRLGAGVASSLDEKALKEALLDRFISEELLGQMAAEDGMRASDAQVMAHISSDPNFQLEGKYDPERYKTILRINGQNPAAYEEGLRKSLVLSQLADGIAATDLALKNEQQRLHALRAQTRSVELVKFTPGDYREGVSPTDEQMRKHYDAHKAEYTAPEQVSIEYLDLSAKALQASVEVTDEELHAWYDEHSDQYLTPERREANHILIEAAAGDKAAAEAAHAKAIDLLARIRAGESFEELAKSESDDPGSAPQGGDLGAIERGMMVPEFEDALFKLKEGDVSDPVHTDFGWHIIKLRKVITPQGKAFESVRSEVEKQLRAQKAEDLYFTRSELLADRGYEVPDTLEVAAQATGLEVQESGLFSRDGGGGVAENKAVVEAAFSDEVLNGGNNSAPIEIGENHVVMLRVKDHIPERALGFDEVKDRIREALINEKATETAHERAQSAKQQLLAGKAAKQVAEAIGGEYQHIDGLRRDDRTQDPRLRERVFRMTRPADSGTVAVSIADLAGGVVAAIHLQSVNSPKAESADDRADQRAALINGRRAYDAFIERLKADAKVEVHKENL